MSKEPEEEEVETTMVCGITLYRRSCSICKQKIWSQWEHSVVCCDDCIYPKASKDFGSDTGGGTQINRKGETES